MPRRPHSPCIWLRQRLGRPHPLSATMSDRRVDDNTCLPAGYEDHVVVVGAGLAGLSTALALHKVRPMLVEHTCRSAPLRMRTPI